MFSEFLKRLSYTITPFTKADLVNLAKHLGWSKAEKVPKKAELRAIVEGLAVSVRLLEVVPQLLGGTVSFEQYMEMEKERLQFELEHERMTVEVVLERERVKVEQLKLELIKEEKAHVIDGHW